MDDQSQRDRPRLLGDFKLLHEVGRGGMGIVYRARQLSLNRDVALKVLSREALHDSERVLRFQREAALLGRLNSPHIVQVFTIGQERDEHFLAMEFVEGTDLEKVLRARHDGRAHDLPESFRAGFTRAAVTVVRDVALGLGAAHEQGIVHRDVKPSNVLLAKDGRALLGDFGLARDLSAAALTTSGMMLGTPFYMSPERFKGAALTPAADVYALGAMLYECVTDHRPFESLNPERLMKSILDDDPPPPRAHEKDVPKDLETITLKCLEKDPALRYPNAAALAADLTRFLAGDPIEASGTGPVTRLYRRVRRRRVSALALWSVAVLAVGIGGKWWWDHRAAFVRDQTAAFEKALDADHATDAAAALDLLLQKRPDLDLWRFERAELAMREKRWDDAARDFRTLIDRDARPAAARIGLSIAESLRDKRVPDAPPEGESDDGREMYYRGIVHQARRELPAALAETERALAIDPTLIEARFALGGIKYRVGDIDGAERAFQEYRARRQRFETDMYLGKIDVQRANFESAESNFERATRARPDSVVAWTNLAATRVMLAISWERNLGDWSKLTREKLSQARSNLESARKLDANHFMVDFNDAILKLVTDERWTEEADQLFQRALERGGRDPEWGVRMRIYFARTLAGYDAQRGFDQLAKVPATSPDVVHDYLWVYSFADVARRLDRDAEALAAIDVALAGKLDAAQREPLTKLRREITGRDE